MNDEFLEEKDYTREMRIKKYIKEFIQSKYMNDIHFKNICNTQDKDLVNRYEEWFKDFIISQKLVELRILYIDNIAIYSIYLENNCIDTFDSIDITKDEFLKIINLF